MSVIEMRERSYKGTCTLKANSLSEVSLLIFIWE